jgi:hypothetical protein
MSRFVVLMLCGGSSREEEIAGGWRSLAGALTWNGWCTRSLFLQYQNCSDLPSFSSSAQQILSMRSTQDDLGRWLPLFWFVLVNHFVFVLLFLEAFRRQSSTLINHSVSMASKLSPSSEGLSASSRLVRKLNGG